MPAALVSSDWDGITEWAQLLAPAQALCILNLHVEHPERGQMSSRSSASCSTAIGLISCHQPRHSPHRVAAISRQLDFKHLDALL